MKMNKGKMFRRFLGSGVAGFLVLLFLSPAWAGGKPEKSMGQNLYVPAYSHVFHGDRNQPFNLTVTLSVRNLDRSRPVSVLAADYYDSKGTLIRSYIKGPVSLAPLSSVEFVVKETDTRGGPGAGFVVRWKSERPITSPLVETVMIGTAAAQGISFVGEARLIEASGD
jgi:hypothetical protein